MSSKKTTYTMREFQLKLRKLTKRVKKGERITVTRRGKPVAVLINPQELLQLEARLGRALVAYEKAEAVRRRAAYDAAQLGRDPESIAQKRREIVDLKEL